MGEITNQFCVDEREVGHREVFKSPLNCFKVSKFTHYGQQRDPAGLCDGGDYHHNMQLRLEDDGTIYTTVRPTEWSEHRTVSDIPYEEFVEAYCAWLKKQWPDQVQDWGGSTKVDDVLKIQGQDRKEEEKEQKKLTKKKKKST